MNHIDLLPTIAGVAGVPVPDDRVIDGVDLMPFVTGKAPQGARPHDTLFWRQGYQQTVLHDGWKLITEGLSGQRWLFDLAADPTEQRNLAAEQPQRWRTSRRCSTPTTPPRPTRPGPAPSTSRCGSTRPPRIP
ncbi:MAG: hypothetical protein U5R48_18405 [Gammaproteobacteria bacterium]|nr:hypothetical protein [Gammaproteobacteria bacterium]